MRLLFVVFISIFLASVSGSEPGKQGLCRVDFVAVIYGSPNGSKPIVIKGLEKALVSATKAVAYEVLTQVLKKMNSVFDLATNLNTGKLAHHVSIVYAYRFIHRGKPVGEWHLESKNRLLSHSGVDYFFYIKDSRERAHQEVKNLQKEISEQLRKQCEEHE